MPINFLNPVVISAYRWALQAMSTDPGRPSINQLLFGDQVVGTDGHRIHVATVPYLDDIEPTCIPGVVAKHLIPMFKGHSSATFYNRDGGDSGVCADRFHIDWVIDIDALFPDYQGIVDAAAKGSTVVKASVKRLRSAIKASVPWPEFRDSPVVLMLEPDNNHLSIYSGRGGEDPSVSKVGDSDVIGVNREFNIDVNHQYLLDAMKYGGGGIDLRFDGPTSPIYFEIGEHRCGVIMPTRI